MWVAGITQGLMWREYGADGYLVNSFAETVLALRPMYFLRAFGGLLYLAGAVVMTVNVWRTILGHQRSEAPMRDAAYDPEKDRPLADLIATEVTRIASLIASFNVRDPEVTGTTSAPSNFMRATLSA